jgi:hypothetical protein
MVFLTESCTVKKRTSIEGKGSFCPTEISSKTQTENHLTRYILSSWVLLVALFTGFGFSGNDGREHTNDLFYLDKLEDCRLSTIDC